MRQEERKQTKTQRDTCRTRHRQLALAAWNAAKDLDAISQVARALEETADASSDQLRAGLHVIAERTDVTSLRLDDAVGADAHRVGRGQR